MRRFNFILLIIFTLLIDAPSTELVAHKSKNPFSFKTIVIDAGHGGHDSGCLGAFEKEKYVTLDIALKLGALIEKNMPDVKVIYTRKTDEFIELYERAEIANRNNADLFISIHCNANKNTSAYGTESWVMGLHKSEANLEVAKRENSSILLEDNYSKNYEGFDPNAPESYIIFSLNQSAYIDQSISLASQVEKEFDNDGRTTRGVKQAGYLVLWRTTMPAILIETGFLTNRAEEKVLASDEGQNQIAHSILDAVKVYRHSIDGTIYEETPDDNKTGNGSIKINPDDGESPLPYIEKKEDSIPIKTEIKIDTGSIKKTEPSPIKTVPTNTVIYKVQIAASDKNVSKTDPKFSSIKDMVNDKSAGGLNRYVVGNYSKRSDAEARMKTMKAKGYKDAFVIAYKNGKRVALESVK